MLAMDNIHAALLADIRSFIELTGMGKSYFGRLACNNSELVSRLERGGSVTLRTAEQIRRFIAQHKSKHQRTGEMAE